MPNDYFRHSGWTIAALVLFFAAFTTRASGAGSVPVSSQPAMSTLSVPLSAVPPSPSPSKLPTPKPTLGPESYRLKPWTEQDSLNAILDGEKIDPDADRLQPLDKPNYLYTLEREALLRFEGKHRDEIEWKFVRDQTIMWSGVLAGTPEERAPADPFVHALGKAMNSGQVTPDILRAWLPSKGFEVGRRLLADNLFGDGQPAEVVEIKTPRVSCRTPGSILLALSKSPRTGNYRLASVRRSWLEYDPCRQSLADIDIVDRNGNGQPEIETRDIEDLGGYCEGKLGLYEWKGGESKGGFENIVDQVKPELAERGDGLFGDYMCRVNLSWVFGQPDARGAQPLTVKLYFHNWGSATNVWYECADYVFDIRFEWDGSTFRWVSAGASLPSRPQSRKCLVGWAQSAAKDGLYDQAIPLVVSALADWPKELDDIWGPSAKDLLRFKLGTWYGFKGDHDKATSTLQDIVDKPANPAFDTVPKMAAMFLLNYQSSKVANGACDDVYSWLEGEFWQTPDDSSGEAYGRTIAAWGFGEPDWLKEEPRLEEVCSRKARLDKPWEPQVSVPSPEYPPSTPAPATLEFGPWGLFESSQLIQEILFTDGNSRLASQLIERLYASGKIEETGSENGDSFFRYLLGLAYELSGDERKAVDNYWRVSQQYPQSLYARIAQEKMQRVGQ